MSTQQKTNKSEAISTNDKADKKSSTTSVTNDSEVTGAKNGPEFNGNIDGSTIKSDTSSKLTDKTKVTDTSLR